VPGSITGGITAGERADAEPASMSTVELLAAAAISDATPWPGTVAGRTAARRADRRPRLSRPSGAGPRP